MANSHLNTITFTKGSRKRVKRIARGQGSGHGGTATRGHKGEGARSGTHYRPWFEGGQMPLIRRIPKFGFHSPFRTEYQIVNVSVIEKLFAEKRLTDSKVTPEVLYTVGAISKKSNPVKILGEGDLKSKAEIHAHAFSKSAVSKIEGCGGKAVTISSDKK